MVFIDLLLNYMLTPGLRRCAPLELGLVPEAASQVAHLANVAAYVAKDPSGQATVGWYQARQQEAEPPPHREAPTECRRQGAAEDSQTPVSGCSQSALATACWLGNQAWDHVQEILAGMKRSKRPLRVASMAQNVPGNVGVEKTQEQPQLSVNA